MRFKCLACGKILKRDGRNRMYKGKKSIKSYCDKFGVDAKATLTPATGKE